jgi:hypothetical protein
VNGAVLRVQPPVDEAQAIAIRQRDGNVVVCGPDKTANSAMAQGIEQAANGYWERCKPHVNAGPNAFALSARSPRPDKRAHVLRDGHKASAVSKIMNYFTPELYQQFNSFDGAEAERADAAWDRAEAAYRERLESIRNHMPSQVVKLSELCLHDALVVSRGEQVQPAGEIPSWGGRSPVAALWSAVALVSVTIGMEVVSLIYCLSDHIATKAPPAGWRFSKLQEQWLYDEVDTMDDCRGPFVHRVLLSSGVTVEIPFVSVIVHRFSVSAAKVAKQSA